MTSLKKLFDNNKVWSDNVKEKDPEFFSNLSKQQTPEYLWIGCSDSRVPATQILNLQPGDIFVHRNIANQALHSDFSCLSVIQYAVEALKVKHIIVCGHYGCGGVMASMGDDDLGLINHWLQNIKTVQRFHAEELNSITDHQEKVNRLCELNVVEQVRNICNNSVVQNAWKSGQQLTVHGLIYSLADGILKDLEVSVDGSNQ